MGILEALLGKTNPAAQWAGQNRNWLDALGAGIGSGQNIQTGLSNALALTPQARQADTVFATTQKAEAERQDQINKTTAWLQANYPQYAGLPPDEGFKLATATMGATTTDPFDTVKGRTEYADQFGLQGDDRTRFILTKQLPGGNANVRAGVGQPIFGLNTKTKKIEPWQSMTDGTMVNTANKDANPADYNFDPAIVAQQRAAGTAQGKIGGTTAGNLPLLTQTVENALQTIQKARGLNADGTVNDRMSQGLNDTFGTYGVGPIQIPDQWGLTMPQSAKQDYASVLDQLGGQAFLGAYQQLRGAGAITEMEGAKAGDAVARLNRAQSKEAFNNALNDYEAVLKAGYAKLQQIAVDSGGADPSTLPSVGGAGDPVAAADALLKSGKY